jgi:hypothetical protein
MEESVNRGRNGNRGMSGIQANKVMGSIEEFRILRLFSAVP